MSTPPASLTPSTPARGARTPRSSRLGHFCTSLRNPWVWGSSVAVAATVGIAAIGYNALKTPAAPAAPDYYQINIDKTKQANKALQNAGNWAEMHNNPYDPRWARAKFVTPDASETQKKEIALSEYHKAMAEHDKFALEAKEAALLLDGERLKANQEFWNDKKNVFESFGATTPNSGVIEQTDADGKVTKVQKIGLAEKAETQAEKLTNPIAAYDDLKTPEGKKTIFQTHRDTMVQEVTNMPTITTLNK